MKNHCSDITDLTELPPIVTTCIYLYVFLFFLAVPLPNVVVLCSQVGYSLKLLSLLLLERGKFAKASLLLKKVRKSFSCRIFIDY